MKFTSGKHKQPCAQSTLAVHSLRVLSVQYRILHEYMQDRGGLRPALAGAYKKNSERQIQAVYTDSFTRSACITAEANQLRFRLTPELENTSQVLATAAVKVLEELGIVAEVTGQKKNRSYSHARYIALLSE